MKSIAHKYLNKQKVWGFCLHRPLKIFIAKDGGGIQINLLVWQFFHYEFTFLIDSD